MYQVMQGVVCEIIYRNGIKIPLTDIWCTILLNGERFCQKRCALHCVSFNAPHWNNPRSMFVAHKAPRAKLCARILGNGYWKAPFHSLLCRVSWYKKVCSLAMGFPSLLHNLILKKLIHEAKWVGHINKTYESLHCWC